MLFVTKPKPFASASTTSTRHLVNLRALVLLIFSTVLLVCFGCGDSQALVAPNTQAGSNPVAGTPKTGPGKLDPLDDVLRLAKSGDIDAAIEQFVAGAPENWLDTTAVEEFQMSEADFAGLSRSDRTRLQQQVIGRVSEIKRFARTVIGRATDARNRGDEETAQQYIDAVRRFGRQLRDSDILVVFQQTGNALSNASLPE